MDSNPFSAKRFEVARNNLAQLDACLKNGRVNEFGSLVEKEALMLHALMMTSDPYFLLFKPNTLHIIEKVWDFRNKNGNQLYITLDAGANVHLLYPEHEKDTAKKLIDNELVGYCENMQYLCDEVGNGPEELK
jgi:diphosphomevalonate decarboxylase